MFHTSLSRLVALVAVAGLSIASVDTTYAQGPAFAGIFGNRNLRIENPNAPGTFYSMLLHNANEAAVYDKLEYDAARGYGYVVLNPGDTSDNRFGPFDDSPNGRNRFENNTSDHIYNSFIGFKDFATTCDETIVGDRTSPCASVIDPDGGIFRVDVPNGSYRFVAAMGDADNPHAHRLVAESGGTGGAGEYVEGKSVVLIGNHDQAQWYHGHRVDRFGGGVFARVGFDDKLPPQSDAAEGIARPQFVDYDENGEPVTQCTSPRDPNDEFELLWKDETVIRPSDNTEFDVPDVTCTSAGPSSPTLEVTDGYIRFHILQGNSNHSPDQPDGPFFTPVGGPVNMDRDPNGGDMVLLEVWPVTGGGVKGDYNGNGILDAEDPDFIIGALGTNNPTYDVDGDGTVTPADLDGWVKRDDYAKSWIGDANLDGEFKSNDFVTVFLAGKYESGEAAKYGEGDWNGDGLFTSNDFVAAFLDGGYEAGPRPAVATVPEPAGLALLSVGLLGLLGIRRRR